MESQEVIKAAKIVIVLLIAYYVVSEVSNPGSIFGKYVNYFWVFVVALLAVSITYFFSRMGAASL